MANPAPGVPRANPAGSRIGFICGSDTHAAFVPISDSMANVGSTDIMKLRPADAEAQRLHVHRTYLRSPITHTLEGLTTIINLVTDADLNPRVLAASRMMLKGFRGRVLNPPGAILRNTRDAVAALLQGVPDLTMPVTIRLPRRPEAVAAAVARAGLVFPCLFREIGMHSGATLRLVDTIDEVVAAMERGRGYYLTQFVDTRGADGLYRKVRAFCFGRTWIVRHQLVCDHWKVHSLNGNAFMATRPALMAEEVAVVTAGVEGLPAPIQAAMEAVRKTLGLDFFGIDFAIEAGGKMVVFEANATMNLLPVSTGPGFAHMEAVRDKAARALEALLAEPAR